MGTERRPPKHRARTKLAHPTKGRTVKVTTLSDSQLRRMTRATKRIGKDGQKVRVWK